MGWAGTYRTLGPKGLASYAVWRLAAILPGVDYHRYRLVAVPRTGMPAMPRGLAAHILSEGELLASAHALELSEQTLSFRLGQGMSCLGAFRGDRLLGVTWLTEHPFDEDEVSVRFVPPPGAAWDTGLYVRPEERGGRAFAALWAGTAAWLAARGLDWSMSRINDYNDGAWRAHRRMGARAIDTLAAVRIGRHQWLSGARPRCTRLGGAAPVRLLPMPGSA